jgi:hypothetical protein
MCACTRYVFFLRSNYLIFLIEILKVLNFLEDYYLEHTEYLCYVPYKKTYLMVMKSYIFWDTILRVESKSSKKPAWRRQQAESEQLDSLFDPEGGDNMFLWSVSWLSLDYMTLYPRRWNSSVTTVRSPNPTLCWSSYFAIQKIKT